MSGSSVRSGSTHRGRAWPRARVVTVVLALALGAVTAPPSDAHAGHAHRVHQGTQAADGTAVRAWNEITVN
ncbi:hypothetical protein, partial [Nocardioides panacihumi]|uniref:hypothetical protein n=1 Tax=Nocardioides panacihumi TaxID=400774 RepID=UPI0031D04682